jgi:hypothetical protein
MDLNLNEREPGLGIALLELADRAMGDLAASGIPVDERLVDAVVMLGGAEIMKHFRELALQWLRTQRAVDGAARNVIFEKPKGDSEQGGTQGS